MIFVDNVPFALRLLDVGEKKNKPEIFSFRGVLKSYLRAVSGTSKVLRLVLKLRDMELCHKVDLQGPSFIPIGLLASIDEVLASKYVLNTL